jgi:hypothetical protein
MAIPLIAPWAFPQEKPEFKNCRFYAGFSPGRGNGNNRTIQMRHWQDNAILKSIQGVKRGGGNWAQTVCAGFFNMV